MDDKPTDVAALFKLPPHATWLREIPAYAAAEFPVEVVKYLRAVVLRNYYQPASTSLGTWYRDLVAYSAEGGDWMGRSAGASAFEGVVESVFELYFEISEWEQNRLLAGDPEGMHSDLLDAVVLTGVQVPSYPPIALDQDWQSNLLRSLYDIRNADRVGEFLSAHSELTAVLVSAHRELKQFFGEEVKFALDVTTDQHAPNHDQLTVWILTTQTPNVAVEQRQRFSREWWLKQPYEVRRCLSFALEPA